MPTLAEIDRQIAAYQHRYIFWTRKEIRSLPEILHHDETIRAITSGIMNNATWLAVCTNQRLLFLNRGMFFGLRQFQIPLDRVQSMDSAFSIIFGSISVWDGASSFTMNLVLKSSIMPFVKTTEEAIQQYKHSSRSASQNAGNDIASQLERLVALKEKGHLSEEEFQQQKKKLLAD